MTKALEIGAYAVVVGSIITRPQLITARYVAAAKSVREGRLAVKLMEKKLLVCDLDGTLLEMLKERVDQEIA